MPKKTDKEISTLRKRQVWTGAVVLGLAYYVYAHELAITQISSFLVRITGGR